MTANSVTQSTMPRAFILPNDRAVSLRCYLDSWRALKTLDPSAEIRGWNYSAEPVAAIRREILQSVNDRVNLRGRLPMSGRKWDSDWQRAARHCANAVNTPRLIVRYVPVDFRARLAHRIYTED